MFWGIAWESVWSLLEDIIISSSSSSPSSSEVPDLTRWVRLTASVPTKYVEGRTQGYRMLLEIPEANLMPVELFVFPGMAHPVTEPRENHAVMHQNLAWFSHHLLGEELELE